MKDRNREVKGIHWKVRSTRCSLTSVFVLASLDLRSRNLQEKEELKHEEISRKVKEHNHAETFQKHTQWAIGRGSMLNVQMASSCDGNGLRFVDLR